MHRIIDTKLFYILKVTANEFTNYKWLCDNRPRITDCGNRPWSPLRQMPPMELIIERRKKEVIHSGETSSARQPVVTSGLF